MKALLSFYQQLATLISGGIDINRSLDIIAQRRPHPAIRKAIIEIKTDIEKGEGLAEAMARHSHLFSPVQIMMVKVGEESGKLDLNLKRIAQNLEINYKRRLKFITSLIYPIILLHAFIFIPAIVPLILSGFTAFGKQVLKILLPLYGTFLILFILTKLVLRVEGLRRVYDNLILYIPIFGPLAKRLSIARFARTLENLYSAGADIMQAVKTAAKASGNKAVEKSALEIIPEIEKGATLNEAFLRSRIFPPLVIDMVHAGEESGGIDKMLTKIAQYYEEESDAIINRLIIGIPILLYLIIAGFIAYYIISSYLKYLGDITQLTGF